MGPKSKTSDNGSVTGWLRAVLDRGPWRAVLAGIAVFAVSSLVTAAGVRYAEAQLDKGRGYVSEHTGPQGLFRFDSTYYLDIATDGYSYDGDPCSSQNVVFMPAFPMLTRAVSRLSGLGPIDAGFWVVRLCLLVGSIVLFRFIDEAYGTTAAWFVLLGLHFSAGSWAFHAYYAESVMLLFLALSLYFHRSGRDLPLALSACLLSATRVTVAPFSALFALHFMIRAGNELRARPDGWGPTLVRTTRDVAYAAVCVGGLAGYLIDLQRRYGDPFELIASIKHCAWSKFHQPMSLLDLFTFRDLLHRIGEAMERTEPFLTDVRTTSLIWTVLALAACVVPLARRRLDFTVLGFCGYFLLTYYATGKSEWLQSNFRYFAAMFTIYLLAYESYTFLLERWPAAVVRSLFVGLLAVNAVYMWIYLTRFAAGHWYYF
jgi:hypothetical protein